MAIPDFQTTMRPILAHLEDGATRRSRDVVSAMSDAFGLSEREREEMIPSGLQTVIFNRVTWATTYMFQAGLIERPARGHVRITEAGRAALRDFPERIDMKTLEAYPSYVEFKKRRRKPSIADDSDVAPADEDLLSDLGAPLPEDIVRWRAKVDQIEAALAADPVASGTRDEREALRAERSAEARALLDRLGESRDFKAFKIEADEWSRREGPFRSFRGFGQMWINQVANNLPEGDTEITDVLIGALATPASIEEALARFATVEKATHNLAGKGRPEAGRIPYVLSLFWSTDVAADPAWPVLWSTAADRMAALGWSLSKEPAERYRSFVEAARRLSPTDVQSLDWCLWFLNDHRFVGINPTLPEICAEAAEILEQHTTGAGYPDEATGQRAASLALQLKGELAHAMDGLLDDVRQRTGLELETSQLQLKTAFNKAAPYRADAYATWSLPGGMSKPGLRLWATRSGLALGLYVGWKGSAGVADTYPEQAKLIAAEMPGGHTFFQIRSHRSGDRLEPVDDYPGGEVFAGRWWTWDEVPQGLKLTDAVLSEVAALTPALKAVSVAHEPSAPQPEAPTAPVGELAELAARYRVEAPYPKEKDRWHQEQRVELARGLRPESLSAFDLELFRAIASGSRYASPGPQSVLNASLSAMAPTELEQFARRLEQLLWGEGTPAERIDRALDQSDLGTKGLGESVILKLFAIVDPDRFLPVFPPSGPFGKLAMLERLGLPAPDTNLTRGEQQVEANDALRRVLEPHFPKDPWGQAQFGYWLLAEQEGTDGIDEPDRIAVAATETYLPEEFLRDLVDLLQEKGQMIFYGPPGTGKTYVAERLAAAIQPDPERRMMVQFHPSMSYEDFFEGYRPETDSAGQMVYKLRKGPLALLAEKAAAAPGVPHLLLIDEINRANLPRVFGELLFLLEYRNKAVRTAYRPEEPFELPANLYVIGTMNTADRSIALVDAALRRRFHFIPFMPHEGVMEQVLDRWLADKGEPAWVAGLVDRVNDQLRVLLRGDHLQIGHSHFITNEAGRGAVTLTDKRLERIWTYDIYPFIEDQLHGKLDQLARFTWRNVLAQYGEAARAAAEEDAQAAAEETASDDVAG